MFAKVATPSMEVVVAEGMLVVTPLIVCCRIDVLEPLIVSS